MAVRRLKRTPCMRGVGGEEEVEEDGGGWWRRRSGGGEGVEEGEL